MTTQTQSKPCKVASPRYSGVQLLTRAYHLIKTGPLDGKVCGPWCPWCALGEAHRQLELECQIKLPLHRVLTRLVSALFHESRKDWKRPLIDACHSLEPSVNEHFNSAIYDGITQEDALFVLKRAGAWVEEDKPPRKIIRSCPKCGLEILTSHEFCPECRRAER